MRSVSPDPLDAALVLLMEALRHPQLCSPVQHALWESGVAGLPSGLSEGMPSLSTLLQLAERTWPCPLGR